MCVFSLKINPFKFWKPNRMAIQKFNNDKKKGLYFEIFGLASYIFTKYFAFTNLIRTIL